MSDPHVLYLVLRSSLENWSNGTRGTGKTERLFEQVNDGDIVVFAGPGPAKWGSDELRRRGVNAKCIAARSYDELKAALRGFRGQLHFDHTFLEQYFRDGLQFNLERLEGIRSYYRGDTGLDRPVTTRQER
jgi:hypothetical protein